MYFNGETYNYDFASKEFKQFTINYKNVFDIDLLSDEINRQFINIEDEELSKCINIEDIKNKFLNHNFIIN